MGLRLRKSLNLGPIRWTVSKSGVSTSVGWKGYRVTKTARGSVRQTASLPGTGISYVTETKSRAGGRRMRQAKIPTERKSIFRRWWFWVLLFVLLMSMAGGIDEQENAQQSPEPTAEALELLPVSPEPSDALRLIEATPEATPEPIPKPTPTPEPEYDWVLNTKTMVFHWSSCSSVKRMSAANRWDYTGTRSSVLSMGYEPCGQCHP